MRQINRRLSQMDTSDSYLPNFLRFLSEDSLKLKNKMNLDDWRELEEFNHSVQVTVLVIAFIWAVSWCLCTQVLQWRRERVRFRMINEAVKRR
jgi:hypothetical protein